MVAVELDVRQPGEMSEAAGDSGLMTGTLEVCADRLVAAAPGQIGAAVEHPVVRIGGFGIIVGAGIGARRMAGDQIIDFEAVFDRPDSLLKQADWLVHRGSPKFRYPGTWSCFIMAGAELFQRAPGHNLAPLLA